MYQALNYTSDRPFGWFQVEVSDEKKSDQDRKRESDR